MANSNEKTNGNKTSTRQRKKQKNDVSDETRAGEKTINEEDKKKERKQQYVLHFRKEFFFSH